MHKCEYCGGLNYTKRACLDAISANADYFADNFGNRIPKDPAQHMQTQLFPNEEPLARTEDPDTSHIAAAKLTSSGKRDSWKVKLLDWLKGLDIIPGDLTSHEISHWSGIPHPTVHKRLPDLRRDGLVVNVTKRTCRITGEYCLTWRVK